MTEKDPAFDAEIIETIERHMCRFNMVAGETFYECGYCNSSEVYDWSKPIKHEADCDGPRLIQYIKDRQ